MGDKQKIEELLTRGVAEVIDREHLKKRLLAGEKLRVKFGIDPTSPNLHLGHTAPLRKLRQFQDLGHQVIFLIGDFTAQIGDPSGRSEMRPILTEKQIKDNMKTYTKQAALVLNMKHVEIRYNSEWYAECGPQFIVELTSKFTVARILERDDFQKRIKESQDISMLETLYSLLQGYDSVALKADVEIGGTDQKFNLLMGRKVQKRYKFPEQDILTTLLVEGLDGVHKMSKSLHNDIGLTESAEMMYGKVMSVPDGLMWKYLTLLTDVPLAEIEQLKRDEGRTLVHPKDIKMRLAREIVTLYHGAAAARKAEEQFVRTFQKHETPEKITNYKLQITNLSVVDLLVKTNLSTSKSEARRVVEQGGVKIDDRVIDDPAAVVQLTKKGVLVQKGKRHFVRVISQ